MYCSSFVAAGIFPSLLAVNFSSLKCRSIYYSEVSWCLFCSLGEAYSGLNFTKIPPNVDAARKYLLHGEKHSFITYVVCSSCDSIYDYDSCVLMRGSVKESKRYQHIAYPNHPQPSRRRECGTLVLKSSRLGKLIPIKVYP